MAGLFARAKSQSGKSSSAKKAATCWLVGDNEITRAVSKSVQQLCVLNAESKALEAKMAVHKKIVSDYAFRNYVSDFAQLGVPPVSPMKVQDGEGNQVTYVVQDRSAQYDVRAEQVDRLMELLGPDLAEDCLYEEVTIGLDRDIMAIPGVSEAVERSLERAISKLIGDGILTEDQSEKLVNVSQKRAFKPGTLGRAAMIVGRDTVKLRQFVEAMGSSCCRYVKT